MITDFGERLKQMREEKGISQKELADKAEIDRTYMSKLESDSSNPSYDKITKICESLGISLADFFGETEKIEKEPGIILSGLTKKQAEQYLVKTEFASIRIVQGLKPFSRSGNLKEDRSIGYTFLKKGMFKDIKNLVGAEVKGDVLLSDLKMRKAVLIIDTEQKEVCDSCFYLMEFDSSKNVELMRAEVRDNVYYFCNDTLKKQNKNYIRLKNKFTLDEKTIRGKVIAVTALL